MKHNNNDVVDAILYPYYEKLVRFIPRPITPNQLTLIGFFSALAACVCLLVIPYREKLLLAAVLLYFWSFFDAMDGILARSKGDGTGFGSFLDHTVDAIAVLILFATILYAFQLNQIAFILAYGLRMLVSVTTYVLSSHVDYLYLSRIGPTSEQFLCILLFVVTYFYPGDLISYQGAFKIFGDLTGRSGISVIGLGMLSYYLVVPVTVIQHFLLARRELSH